MRKITSIIITLVMTFYCVGAMADTVRIPLGTQKGTPIELFAKTGSNTPLQIDSSTTAAQYFKLEKGNELQSVSVCCASYADNVGSLDISVYKWAGSVEKTIKGKALASETFVDFKDGANLVLDVPGSPTGELMIYVNNGTQKVGVWLEKNENYPQRTFANGKEQENLFLRSTVTIKDKFKIEEAETVHTEPRNAYECIPAADYDGFLGITVKNLSEQEQEFAGTEKAITGRIERQGTVLCLTSLTDPMGYTESHTYDYLGNMLSQTDKNGNTVTFEYNAFGLESKTDGETEIVNIYNGLGRLVSANTTGQNQTSYAYDPLVTLGRAIFVIFSSGLFPLILKKGDESLKKLKLISVLLALLLLVSVVPVSAETTEAVSGIEINNVTYEVTGINDEFIKITAGCTEQEGVTAVLVMVVPENTETVALNDIIYINRFGKSNSGEYTITLRKSKILEKTNNSALVQVV